MSHRKIPVSGEGASRSSAQAAAAGSRAGSASDPTSRDAEGAGPGPGAGESRREDGRPGSTAADPGAAPETELEAAPEPRTEAGREPAAEAAARDQLLRLAAEFDNFRKREARERAEAWNRAKADLIDKLLPALDDLRRVAHPEAAEAPPGSPLRALLGGVELVERKLLQVLEREGLAPVEAEGAPFDPALHEAILTRPTDDPALEGRVAHVAVPGWRFADRLLRPAKVVVWTRQR